jgi:hypothetical protein
MPPMPANAVLVHELENKLESASLNPAPEMNTEEKQTTTGAPPPASQTDGGPLDGPLDTKKDLTVTQTQQQPPSVVTSYPAETPIVPAGMSNYSYGMGMYNYNPSNVGNGFVGIHTPAGPVLTGGVLPQQQKIQQNTSNPPPNPGVHPPQQNALYGAPSSSNPLTDNNPTNNSDQNAGGGLPPGMPAMQYNPALFNYPQYPQMGQPHGGVGYGYPYNQFQQGGFAYHNMGQNGAYPTSYDDHHASTHSSHHNSSSGYQKSSHQGGRYRGQNSHHQSHHTSSTHQYQNQYNPPNHYTGQPYNMNYVDLHRGGYAPPVTADPNMYNSGYNNQNFDDAGELHQKKKGTNRSNGGFGGPQPFQGPPQGGGQGFGFPTGERNEGSSGNGGGGWSNQSWVAPSWQGN